MFRSAYNCTCLNHAGRTFGDGQGRTPLVSKNVQANAAIRVDVWVVDAGCEIDLWRLEGVVGREVDGEEEDAARVRAVALFAKVSGIFVLLCTRCVPRLTQEDMVLLTGPMIVACQ